jgi:hypothetical protein
MGNFIVYCFRSPTPIIDAFRSLYFRHSPRFNSTRQSERNGARPCETIFIDSE